MERRAVVTGMGVVSPAGTTLEAFWAALTADADGPVRTELAVDPTAWMGRAEASRTDSRVHLAVGAALAAVEDAGAPAFDPLRTGVVLGNTHGAAARVEEEDATFRSDGPKAVPPYLAVLANDNAPAAAVAQRVGVRGPCWVVGGACASGTYAVDDAARLVRTGRCDAALAGATSGDLPGVLLAAYENLRVISADGRVRPFDRRRDGFVYVPGAAVLVVEEAAAAEARGARIYGEVLGGANTNDAFHPIRQSGSGAVECIRAALADAGVAPDAVSHVNAHGSGTLLNDTVEAAAIREVFGEPGPSVTSIKRVTGHSLGAAGSLEALAVLLSFVQRELPPAGIDVELEDGLGIDVVVGGPRPWEPGPTVSTSFGLGGQNGAVVLTPWR